MPSFNLLIESVLFLLPVLLVIVILVRKRSGLREFSRVPFKELERRPAGEALRIKLEEVNDKMHDAISLIVLVPVMSLLMLASLDPKNLITPATLFILCSTTTAFLGIRLFNLSSSKANYKLGYDGERFVGEELSRLIGIGFEIYHDVPFDGFNIDHVLAGSRGVFAVETKTRSKPVRSGKVEYRVWYDGKALQWPKGADVRSVEQSRNNAKDLAALLTSGTGEKVHATPILTLPGWMVERKVRVDGLYVLNPKEIYDVLASFPETLAGSQIARICHQLNQKCGIEMT